MINMNLATLFLNNLFNLPLLCFLCGILTTFIRPGVSLPKRVNQFLTIYILFSIGLKGGGPISDHFTSSISSFIPILTLLIVCGLSQPVLSFFLLRLFTKVDFLTAAAISASFGSVSVMTFVAAISFLDQLHIHYQELIIAALAVMEIPAIISGVFIAKMCDRKESKLSKILRESLVNKAILTIVIGMVVGILMTATGFSKVSDTVFVSFKPLLCLFLFDMGLHVGGHRSHFCDFSWSLNLFGVYMPLIGGFVGLLLSYLMHVDVGTGTLIAVLTASASYIAVPAAMRIVLPQAKESIYLPLSLGIAFPFNVIIGIPLYYHFAIKLLH